MAKNPILCLIDLVTCVIALLFMKLFKNSEIIDDQLVFLIVFVIGWLGIRIIFAKSMNRPKRKVSDGFKERGVIVITCPNCKETIFFNEGEELKCIFCKQYLG